MVLLAPMFLVVPELLPDDSFEWVENGWFFHHDRRCGGEVLLRQVFPCCFGIRTGFFRNFTDPVSIITQIFDMIDLGHGEYLPNPTCWIYPPSNRLVSIKR